MIRGTEQPFKFTTSFDFDDICNIVAVFSQSHNNGTELAPMPITKYYNKKIEEIDVWNETGKDTTHTYCVGTKYYRYDSTSGWVSSDICPTEADVSGGAITSYPLGESDISKVYKCDAAYYQYDPDTQQWNITSVAPPTDFVELSQDGRLTDADKTRIYEYKQRYYRHDGENWVSSTDEFLPLEEVDYWDNDADKPYDTNKTYCAEETYYKYIDSAWHTYGRDCVMPIEVYAWNSEDTSKYDKSKIYVLREFLYQYNTITDQFEKTAQREVYYRYNTTNKDWEECDAPNVAVEEIDLWVDTDEHNPATTYVCKNVYYRYNAQNKIWEVTNNMLVPVVELGEWVDEEYHDPSRVYMCPAKYYQYDITNEEWLEFDAPIQTQIINLDYWTASPNLDKSTIYFCGPTYYQYDSAWQTSASFSIQVTPIDDASQAIDQSKIYECSPTYYAYDGNEWLPYKDATDIVRNDGFAPVENDPKSFVVMLSAEETMRFNEVYKGRAQVTVYCDAVNRTEKSLIEYFTVYPTMTNEIFSIVPSDTVENIRVLDAGEIR